VDVDLKIPYLENNRFIINIYFIVILMENIDIKKTCNEISQIKNPLVFLFRLLSYINEIDDTNLSIILRIFLKYNPEIAINYNLKQIFIKEFKNKYLSLTVLNDFYKLIKKKITLIKILKKWYDVFENKKFWKLSLKDQIDFLHNTKIYFLSMFDCSKGGIPIHYKVGSILKNNKIDREFIINDLIDRLVKILNIFGSKLFQTLGIPLLTINEFNKLTDENIIKYLVIIFDKFNELLNQTIKLFDSYNLICLQLNNLFNPLIININSINIDSETEIDDIQIYSKF
jgi:hypothetical protein